MSDTVATFGELDGGQEAYAGGKGGVLARLFQAGYPVPDGFVILPGAFANDALTPESWAEVRADLDRLRGAPGTEIAFAVRSSAMGEDSAQASFAGEFETVLNVRTDEAIRRAIRRVYRSRQNERVKAYSRAWALSAQHDIAVVVQELIHAESSGVLFTANPVTGRRDEAVINAAWGLGEAVVSGQVSPDTLLVDKATGRVLERETADKRVMTVLAPGGTEEQLVPDVKSRLPVLSDGQAAELVRLGAEIEAFCGVPVDIEWVLARSAPSTAEGAAAGGAGGRPRFAIVQARPITALPAPEPPLPTKWKLPKGVYSAMRNNIVELMADPLTPLFGTLGLDAVNASLARRLASFFGSPDVMPGEIIISVNEYAYYNGSLKPGMIVRILLGSVGIMKRMFTGAVERWTEEGRPQYVSTVARWEAEDWHRLPANEIVDAARELVEAAIDAYGALVSGVIPAAWITEGLFTVFYERLIKQRCDPAAPVYLMGFDSAPIRAEKSLYDLAQWARARPGLAAYVDDTSAAQLASQLEADDDQSTQAGVAAEEWRGWRNRFEQHLGEYGHAIYNLDFANPVLADDPAPALETLKLFASGQGANPHDRQRTSAERREQATEAMLGRLKRVRLRLFRQLLARAQRYAPLREDGLADIGLSYPLLRQMIRALGSRMASAGMIAARDDIFWLKRDEVEGAAARLDRGETSYCLMDAVPQRKAAWRAAKRVAPPIMLPQVRLFGMGIGQLRARRSGRLAGATLKGVAASPGCVTARAAVLSGPEEFEQMKVGDVLVAPLTTPAWTPLFARAAAIVTDVGGPLSHGSIVAREYGIPAVLGTGEATKRIRSGQVVTVDGSAGVVTVSKPGDAGLS
jgi:pyruvate,water dikinase